MLLLDPQGQTPFLSADISLLHKKSLQKFSSLFLSTQNISPYCQATIDICMSATATLPLLWKLFLAFTKSSPLPLKVPCCLFFLQPRFLNYKVLTSHRGIPWRSKAKGTGRAKEADHERESFLYYYFCH